MAQIKDSVRDHDADDRGPSSTQIRREIERTRAEMDDTFDALESKLTPSQLLGEAWSLTKGGSTAGASKLWQIARQYPLPSAVIGLGLGWLLVESSRSEDSGRDQRSRPRSPRGYRGYGRESYGYSTGYRASADYAGNRYGATGFETEYDSESDYGFEADYESGGEGRLSKAKDAVGGAASSAKGAVAGAAHTVKDTVSDAAHSVRDAASGARHKVGSAAERARYEARMKSRQARTGFWQQMESNPLAMGVATLALGVIAGLSIPSTRKENELMGETRDRVLDEVKERGQEVLEKGKQVANVAVDSVKQAAQDQGLTPDSVVGNMAEKVRTVGREAKNAVKEEVKKQDLLPNAQGGNQEGQSQGQRNQGQNQSQDQGGNRTPDSNLGDGMAGTGLGSNLGGSNLGSSNQGGSGTGTNLGSSTPSPTVGGTPGATMGSASGPAKGGLKTTEPKKEEDKVKDNEPEFSRR